METGRPHSPVDFRLAGQVHIVVLVAQSCGKARRTHPGPDVDGTGRTRYPNAFVRVRGRGGRTIHLQFEVWIADDDFTRSDRVRWTHELPRLFKKTAEEASEDRALGRDLLEAARQRMAPAEQRLQTRILHRKPSRTGQPEWDETSSLP